MTGDADAICVRAVSEFVSPSTSDVRKMMESWTAFATFIRLVQNICDSTQKTNFIPYFLDHLYNKRHSNILLNNCLESGSPARPR